MARWLMASYETVSELSDSFLERSTYGIRQDHKEAALAPALHDLTRHHAGNCPDYGRMVGAAYPGWESGSGLGAVPFIPISMFKQRSLGSVPESAIFKTLTSSGTTGSEVSRILLDRPTAQRQTRALASVMRHILGVERRPMLIIDSSSILRDRKQFSARGAGIVGLMNFGRSPTYLLDSAFRPDADRLKEFATKHQGEAIFIFGFTFMVWRHLIKDLAATPLDLSNAVLVHSGGWKKLEEERVDNGEFRRVLAEGFGIRHVYNFYGMVEQVGGVFIEGDDGLLHPPAFGDVIVRHPRTWKEQPVGEEGVLQVVSVLPTSYPGHSVLTEDLGVVEAIDSSATAHLGKAFRVVGRVPQADLRGCSDTYASMLSAA